MKTAAEKLDDATMAIRAAAPPEWAEMWHGEGKVHPDLRVLMISHGIATVQHDERGWRAIETKDERRAREHYLHPAR